MKYIKELTVMYGDTDSYKVVWHGNYLRFMEEGRYSLCKMIGIPVNEIDIQQGITFPLIDLHIKYKSPAVIFEDIIVETEIAEIKSRTVTFKQIIKNKKTETIHIIAEITCCALSSKDSKMIKLPENIYNAFANAMNN
jgi:acyl-CoA thioester hydrolase